MTNFLVITTILGFFVLVQTRTLTLDQQSKYGPLEAPNCGTIRSRFRRSVTGIDAQLGAFSWMVSIGYKENINVHREWICAGSIISARHVLTDAVCVHTKKYQYVVRVGDLNLDETVADGAFPIDVGVEKIIFHPGFLPKNLHHNIAVLRLERDLQFTEFIKPICLPASQNSLGTNYEGTKAFIAGWGYTHIDDRLDFSRLQTAQIEVLKTSLCMITSENRNNIICAGHLDGKDTIRGDIGAPLMIEKYGSYYLIGITSYEGQCSSPKIPSVYTNVSSYMEWIVSELY